MGSPAKSPTTGYDDDEDDDDDDGDVDDDNDAGDDYDDVDDDHDGDINLWQVLVIFMADIYKYSSIAI